MEYHFSEHFPSWCTESENLLVTVFIWTGYKSLKKIKKTHKESNKMVKRSRGKEERLFTKLALVSENFLLDVCSAARDIEN